MMELPSLFIIQTSMNVFKAMEVVNSFVSIEWEAVLDRCVAADVVISKIQATRRDALVRM